MPPNRAPANEKFALDLTRDQADRLVTEAIDTDED